MRHLLLWLTLITLFCLSDNVLAKENPKVRFVTTDGDLVIELYPNLAPKTVENFLFYVNERRYNHTIFHRVIEGFVVQGGGYKDGMKEIDVEDEIELEADNGLLNERGTIAMARHSKPDSATSQFYFNMRHNANLDPSALRPGYTVFGKVVEGLETLDFISIVETINAGKWQDIPKYPVILIKAEVVQ